MKRLIVVSLLVAVVVVAVGCSSPQAECEEGLAVYMPEMGGIVDEWLDAQEVAMSTSRISLASPVQELQSIKRRAGDVAPPACMASSHADMVNGMDTIIDLFLSFMSDADYVPPSNVDRDISKAIVALSLFPDGVEEYEKDSAVFVQGLYDMQATEEARPLGLDEKMTREAESP